MRLKFISLCVSVVFVGLGCSGIIPCVHILIAHGITIALKQASLGWLILMGVLYLIGALLYATRIPERFFPGKCNIVVSCFIAVALYVIFKARVGVF